MAIVHATLWAKLGKLLKKSNSLNTLGGTTFPADLQEIVAQYGTTLTGVSTAQSSVQGLHGSYSSLMDAVTSMRLAILAFSDLTVLDYDTVVSQLPSLAGFDLGVVLYRLIEDMYDNGQTLVRSEVTVGAVTAGARNVGNGTVMVSKTLDGFNPPVLDGLAHPLYAGIASEMAPTSLTHTFTCVADSYTDGTEPGSEIFAWESSVAWGEASSFSAAFGEGAGVGPSLSVANDGSVISGGDFESFSDDAPSGFDIDSGEAEENFFEETGDVYHGDSCLRIVGDGSTATLQLSQDVSATPLRMYHVTGWVKLAKTSSTGTFSIHFAADDGYTTATGDSSYTLPVSSIPAVWTRFSFYWIPPTDLPANPEFVIRVSGTMASGAAILLDLVCAKAVPYHAGVNADVVPASIPFARGDRLFCSVTSVEGVFQKFARTHWRIQFPSTIGTTGSYGGLFLPFHLFTASQGATISDSLAQ